MYSLGQKITMDTISIATFLNLLESKPMQADIMVSDHDNIVVLMPATKKGKAWLRQNVSLEERKHIGSVIVTQAQINNIITSAGSDGLRVTVD